MAEPWTIRQWQPCLEDAQALSDVMMEAKPRLPRMPPSDEIVRTNKLIEGIEEGALLAFDGERPVGVVLVSNFRNPEVAILMGGVRPDACGRGLGRELLERAESVARARGCLQLRARWFHSDPRAVSFVNAAGFTQKDAMLWSTFDTAGPISAWALQKEAAMLNSGLRVVSGAEFEQVRTDWDRVWWRHLMDCMHDVPMEIPFVELPFETWRPFIEPPLMDRSRVLVALDGDVMVGLMYLGAVRQGKANIDHTGVARAYRRRGVSTMLKCAAVRHAQALGASAVTTQNHEHNPMFALNQDFGFCHVDTEADGLKPL